MSKTTSKKGFEKFESVRLKADTNTIKGGFTWNAAAFQPVVDFFNCTLPAILAGANND